MGAVARGAAVAVASAVLAAALRKDNPAAAVMLGAMAACGALIAALALIEPVADALTGFTTTTGLPAIALAAITKAVGVAVLTRFAGDVCKDAGVSSLASAVEMLGTAGILFAALPLMKTVIDAVSQLIG